jgi:starch phosphorylase
MAVSRYMVEGVDVWLNTPMRPNEASGTSGMKAAANGVLNVSIPDGWWDEVWNNPKMPNDIGWVIGKGESYQDSQYQNQVEAEALYELLEHDIVPVFYDRGPDRLPRKWLERMKASIGALCPFVNTHRMVSKYTCEYYFPAHEHFRSLDAGGSAKSRGLAAWMAEVASEWPRVRIEEVHRDAGISVPVGAKVRVSARIRLGALLPSDVKAELYIGRLDPAGDIVEPATEEMASTTREDGGIWTFEAATPCTRSGMHGFTVRVRPHHPDLYAPLIPGLLCWAGSTSQPALAGA